MIRFATSRLLGGLPADSRLPDVPNSLLVGKKAGNFADSAFFRESPSRKHLQIQLFRDKFPTQPSRELIRASRELFPPARNLQGIWREIDPPALTYPIE